MATSKKDNRSIEEKDPGKRIVRVKWVRKVVKGHSGGSWKIAYADFVTAMMAFFLLMWLLGSSSTRTLHGVSEYFKTPLMVALMGGKTDALDTRPISEGRSPMGNSGLQTSGGVNVARAISLPKDDEEMKRLTWERERKGFEDLKKSILEAINKDPVASKYKSQLLIEVTDQGLSIQVMDGQGRPMFDNGSAVLKPYTVDILHVIAGVLGQVPNLVAISGHTDATTYKGEQAGYSNWELSLDRANAARRELVVGGMNEDRVARVAGLAASQPLEGKSADAPENRRISILLLKLGTRPGDEADAVSVPDEPKEDGHE